MKDKILDYVKEIDWWKWLHFSIITIFFLYINLYNINRGILGDYASKVTSKFQSFDIYLLIVYILSIMVIAFYTAKMLNRRFLLKLFISYLVYLVYAYFIVYTRNLNNYSFKLWDLAGNHFFQTNGLISCLIILALGAIIKFAFPKLDFEQKLDLILEDFPKDNHIILLGMSSMLIMSNSYIVSSMSSGLKQFIKHGQSSQYLTQLIGIVFVIYLITAVIVYSFLRSFEGIRTNNSSLFLLVFSSFSWAVIINFMFQYGVRADGLILGLYIFPYATIFQISLLTVIFILLYLISNRYLSTTIGILVVGMVLAIANGIKVDMRNEPLLYTDLSWLKEIGLVISYIDLTLFYISLAGIVIIAISYIILHKKGLFSGPITNRWKFRLVSITGILVLLTSLFNVFSQQDNGKIANNIPVLSKLNNYQNIEWMGHSVVARERSLIFVWLKQMSSSVMEEPAGYNQAAIEKIVKKYEERAAEINANRSNKIEDQTVIYVLSESFSNPNRIKNVHLNSPVIPYIDSIKSSYTSGLMKSDGYGGGTANMEFQTLVGLPMYNLSTNISTIYTEVVPKMSVLPSISDAYSSKNKIAIHLGDANTYSRREVYRQMGFGSFVAALNGTETAKNSKNLGVYPSDESTYNAVMDKLDSKSNQFLSVITYQNHAPWNYQDSSAIGAQGQGFDINENFYMNNYAKLMYQTDIATKAWLEKLSKMDKKITVVFYGDHLPGFYPSSSFKDKPDTQYQTDYFIWSNYKTSKLNYPLVNSSDFSAELLEQTDSKVSPYYALLTDILENASVNNEPLNDSQKEIANDLKLVQYDIISGKGYLSKNKNFFKVGS